MNFTLGQVNAKEYDGNLVFLYGNEVADRNLPLSKKEVEYLKTKRSDNLGSIVEFDRLPYHLYMVNFDSEEPANLVQEKIRRSSSYVVSKLNDAKQSLVAVTGEGVLAEEVVAFVEGMVLSDYSFDRYKSKSTEHVGKVTIDSNFLLQEELNRNIRLWNRIFWCREWVNLPVADLNAEEFASELEDIAKSLGIRCTVFDKKKIEALRMGGLLGVNKGSVDEPRFVVLEYCPADAVNEKPLALVGKGVMYDTGGLNIKPDEYMREMKSDMAGAATMASVLFAAVENQLPVYLVALLPLTDNRPGFNAYAADDVLTMYDGTTVEVINTDAEGRLILADAISYAVANYQPELLIDAATLTGAAVRAIGTFGIVAMQQNAENSFNLLKIMGNQVYERIAEFPFWDEYDKLIESDVADIKNCGTAQAGTITAGRFLAHFAKQTPYIHLDIAGVAFFSKKQDYYGVGASGYGIRLLYSFLQTYDVVKMGRQA
ncbi:MAG: leucyl aminopeptidase [Bacteroidales bacterium]|nr:leucyl aminopeptidase [Bacteroidales bacterium]